MYSVMRVHSEIALKTEIHIPLLYLSQPIPVHIFYLLHTSFLTASKLNFNNKLNILQ